MAANPRPDRDQPLPMLPEAGEERPDPLTRHMELTHGPDGPDWDRRFRALNPFGYGDIRVGAQIGEAIADACGIRAEGQDARRGRT